MCIGRRLAGVRGAPYVRSPPILPRGYPDKPMMRRPIRQLALLVLLLVVPGSAARAQSGRFDLEKTKRVLTPLIEKTLAENGIPSMSIALVRGDSIVWKAAFGLPSAAFAIVHSVFGVGGEMFDATK